MKGFLLSFLVGLLVGLLYAAVKVRSPAPPFVALTGLLGMVIGEAMWPRAFAVISRLLTGH